MANSELSMYRARKDAAVAQLCPGSWSSAAPVLERAELSRSCKGKGKAFLGTCESATELVAKNNGGEAEQAPRSLPMELV